MVYVLLVIFIKLVSLLIIKLISFLISLTIPILLLTCKDDTIINSEDCYKFLESSSTDNSLYKELKHGKHCLLKYKNNQIKSIIEKWFNDVYNPKINLGKIRLKKT